MRTVRSTYLRDGAYGSSTGFPTEITAAYPGVEYVGGELGPALAFAQGTVMGDPGSLVACVIGDGDLETSIAQASFQGFDFLSPTADPDEPEAHSWVEFASDEGTFGRIALVTIGNLMTEQAPRANSTRTSSAISTGTTQTPDRTGCTPTAQAQPPSRSASCNTPASNATQWPKPQQ